MHSESTTKANDDSERRALADRSIAQGHHAEDAGSAAVALEHYEAACATDTGYPRAHLNRGNALDLLGRHGEAIAAYREALRVDPGYAPAHVNLGLLFTRRNEIALAEVELRLALASEADNVAALVALAEVLERKRDYAGAEAGLKQALIVRPDYAGAALNLAQLYLRQDRFDDAEDCFRRAKAADPAMSSVDAALGALYLKTGRHEEAARAFDQSRACAKEPTIAATSRLFALNFRSEIPASTVYREHVDFGALLQRSVAAPFASWPGTAEPERRLKVGYVSADFRQHPIGLFIRPVLQLHDRKRFEVHCYSNHSANDAVTQALRGSAEYWHSIADVSDDSVVEQIRRDEIDILVDLSGHTSGNRLSVFARQPAAIQVTWLGYLNTTGLRTMSYRLCDAATDPPGETEHLHTERLCRLPYSQWCYKPFYEVPLLRAPHADRPQVTVFGSFNQASKITDDTLALWSDVLRGVPDAELIVLDVPAGRSHQAFADRLTKHGIDVDRVRGRARQEIASYFDAIANVDIALDTFPYNGATTTFDALWMGVPMVALRGARGIARSSYSILRAAGLQELIAGTAQEYVDINVDLAQDRNRRARLRDSLRDQLAASPVMDAPVFVAALESAYRGMWRDWCNQPSERVR